MRDFIKTDKPNGFFVIVERVAVADLWPCGRVHGTLERGEVAVLCHVASTVKLYPHHVELDGYNNLQLWEWQ